MACWRFLPPYLAVGLVDLLLSSAALTISTALLSHVTRSLGYRPTRIAEIVPTEPTHVGSCDAARPGIGGVWVPPLQSASTLSSETISPMVWREPFPRHIQDSLVSFANLKGSITNSLASSATKTSSPPARTAVNALLQRFATAPPPSPGSRKGPSPTAAPPPT
jgi:hypothetical protein